MNMEQELKHGILVSSNVENLVEDGVERTTLFLFHIDLILLLMNL